VASRLRWLAALVALIAAGTAAQLNKPLDLRLPKVTDGIVASVRQINSGSETALTPRSGPRQVGTQSSLDQAPLVGAVVYMPVGPASGDAWRFGAAGTAEMQPWLSESAHEVVVTMEDGERRSFRPRDPGRFYVGQRVTVRSGELEPLGGRKDGT
jgi:hypothetical protein